ncbi:hypothetical protein P7K49_010005, partial [Saguinus oedipus]
TNSRDKGPAPAWFVFLTLSSSNSHVTEPWSLGALSHRGQLKRRGLDGHSPQGPLLNRL